MSKKPIDEADRKLFHDAMDNLDMSDATLNGTEEVTNNNKHNPFKENLAVNYWHQAEDTIEFSKSGSRPAEFRKKKILIERKIDLHGLTLDESADQLHLFINQARSAGLRMILLIHGKGHQASGERATLKSAVAHWLRNDPRILAFKSALPHHGGTGALYVLLK
jgi:DNA-nicking Smr family endonuclease